MPEIKIKKFAIAPEPKSEADLNRLRAAEMLGLDRKHAENNTCPQISAKINEVAELNKKQEAEPHKPILTERKINSVSRAVLHTRRDLLLNKLLDGFLGSEDEKGQKLVDFVEDLVENEKGLAVRLLGNVLPKLPENDVKTAEKAPLVIINNVLPGQLPGSNNDENIVDANHLTNEPKSDYYQVIEGVSTPVPLDYVAAPV